MKVGGQLAQRFALLSLTLALVVSCLAQNRRNAPAPRPSSQPRQNAPRQSRPPQPRSQPAPRYQPSPNRSQPESRFQSSPQRYQPAPQREYQVPRPYQPPMQGHHSGQWLNRHREQPLDQQRRALETDPTFRRLPRQRQQQLEQRLQHFDSLPPERQQRVLRRMETWEHLTAAQKQQFRSTNSQFRSLPPERQQAVRNAIDSLRAMPPDARARAISSGRFNQFSPREQQILNNAARLPLAPAQPNGEQPNTGPQRYIPRPPH